MNREDAKKLTDLYDEEERLAGLMKQLSRDSTVFVDLTVKGEFGALLYGRSVKALGEEFGSLGSRVRAMAFDEVFGEYKAVTDKIRNMGGEI